MDSRLKYHQYYAIRKLNGEFAGHTVVKENQIHDVLKHNEGAEIFTSLTWYYPNGSEAGSIMAFDIDADGDLLGALRITKKISEKLDEFKIKHTCLFSGSKGAHIVIPKLIRGECAYLICRAIYLSTFDIEFVDYHIYKSKSLFRVEGSINRKTGLYKIPIDLTWSLDEILERAKTPCQVKLSIELDNSIDLSQLVYMAGDKLTEIMTKNVPDISIANEYSTVPCLTKMWKDNDPCREDWHDMLYTMAKDSFNQGLELEEVIARFDNHEFWGVICGYGYSRRSYTKIAYSLYRSGKYGLGCKGNGLSAGIMNKYCSKLCWFNDSIDIFELIKGGDNED